MSLVTLLLIVLVLALIGYGMYLLNTRVPMAAGIKTIINILVALVVIFWLLQKFGLLGPMKAIL